MQCYQIGDTSSFRDFRDFVATWPRKSQEVAAEMIKKYGEPSMATDDRLIWKNSGPWVETVVSRDPIPHNWPKPHVDVLKQTIYYQVPVNKYDDLAAFDGSVFAERTKGVLSARCDNEGMNFLAINLANEIARGERSVASARDFYTETAYNLMKKGIRSPYIEGLLFTPSSVPVYDTDSPAPEFRA